MVRYGVANMTALIPRTSTCALANATLPYVMALAEKGVVAAVRDDRALAAGVNVRRGAIVHPAVAASLGEAPAALADFLR